LSHVLPVSDEIYHTIESLARQEGTTPEALAEVLLRERLAERDAIARQNAEWEAGLDEALARAARGENTQYASTEAFFAALDEVAGDTVLCGRRPSM
jgi:predicted transcriptional regulator